MRFDVCIVDDASLVSEIDLMPLLCLHMNVLSLVGDKTSQDSSAQIAVILLSFLRI